MTLVLEKGSKGEREGLIDDEGKDLHYFKILCIYLIVLDSFIYSLTH